MTVRNDVEVQPAFTGRTVLRMLVGAMFGALLGFGFIKALQRLQVPLHHIGWSNALAYWLGVTYFGSGIALWVMSYSRRQVAESLEGYEVRLPATDEEVQTFRLQSASVALAGVLILTPLLAMGSLGQTVPRAWIVLLLVAAIWLLQTWVNLRIWRSGDEFVRLVILKTAAITFAVVQGALFLWAAAEHLHLAPALSSWDNMMLLMTVYLVVSCYFGLKHRPGA